MDTGIPREDKSGDGNLAAAAVKKKESWLKRLGRLLVDSNDMNPSAIRTKQTSRMLERNRKK